MRAYKSFYFSRRALLFIELATTQNPIFAGVSSEIDQEKLKEFYDVLFTIDEHYFPHGNEWIAGENVSAADFAFVATLSSLIVSFFFFPLTRL